MNNELYELLDFGEGRRLERFGKTIFDRPAPNVGDTAKSSPEKWAEADVRYERDADTRGPGEARGQWISKDTLPDSWPFEMNGFHLRLRPTPSGQLGIFPEQIENWAWIQSQVRSILDEVPTPGEAAAPARIRVLNLFAHTGGSTLAAAHAGAEVVHVDAARNSVGWAKRNAECSGLAKAPIRWIVEDATLFAKREAKRGNRYEGLILDPPSYGHGAAGQPWAIQKHLLPLLRNCGELIKETGRFVLLTCHTPGLGPAELLEMVADTLFCGNQVEAIAQSASITSSSGGELPIGTVLRWRS